MGTREDPIHSESGPEVAWTRVNISEGIPGVSTPLNWTFWDPSIENMVRGAYHDMGVLDTMDQPPPSAVDERVSAIFYGRVALNVDLSRRLADLQPGTSGDALEEHYFGAVRDGVQSDPSRRRYPVVAYKTPISWVRTPRQMHRMFADNEPWWRQAVTPAALDDVAGAPGRFVEAHRRFAAMARPHSLASLLATPIFMQLTSLTAAAGKPELMLTLLGGYESIEMETTGDLWDVARGRLDIDEFILRRGYQGPLQGQISARSWREDRRPIEGLLTSFGAMGDDADPRAVERRRVAEREAAEADLLGALGRRHRLQARAVLREARRYIPLREVGKASMMMMLDAARGAARTMGRDLVERGVLAETEDVFMLTFDELTGTPPDDAGALVATRRSRYDEYCELVLPDSWVGMVEPLVTDTADSDDPVRGLAASPGVAEGVAKVLHDAYDPDALEPDEILVCETTDPSYASYFLVASATVIDIGGAMSHGAIVAREMGIPCVINTRDGTRRIRTGDRLRVDGNTGTVDIVERARV